MNIIFRKKSNIPRDDKQKQKYLHSKISLLIKGKGENPQIHLIISYSFLLKLPLLLKRNVKNISLQVLALNYYGLVLGLIMRILLKNFPKRQKMKKKRSKPGSKAGLPDEIKKIH